MYFYFYISNNIKVQLQSIPKQSFPISLNCDTWNSHTKQELQKHVLLTHRAMAKPQLKGYPDLPWELLGKRSQTTQYLFKVLGCICSTYTCTLYYKKVLFRFILMSS